MSIFVVFRVTEPEKIKAAILRSFPDDSLEIQDDEWLVSDSATAKEVAEKLKVPSGENGSAIIFKMDGYFGRASQNVWDWIKTKLEAKA